MYFSDPSVLPNLVMSVMGVLKGHKKHKIKEIFSFLSCHYKNLFDKYLDVNRNINNSTYLLTDPVKW